jgi:hypothetical protein
MSNVIEATSRAWFVAYGIVSANFKDEYTKEEVLALLREIAIKEIDFNTLKDIKDINGDENPFKQLISKAGE